MDEEQLRARVDKCKTRTDIVSAVIDLFDHRSYLEIGCRKDESFVSISCPLKVGVDPLEGGTHRLTSDEFFATNGTFFDAVFIDGDHHHDQALRDALNALKWLSPGGTVMMHDCSPPSASHEGKRNWKCGTAWRAFAFLRQSPYLDCIVADWDYGTGLIRIGHNLNRADLGGLMMDTMTYDDFIAHRDDWMKLADHKQVADWLWAQKQLGA